MNTWIIIPARGGSKGIPRKNLATVGGRSLLARAIEAASASGVTRGVVVSTDDSEIADEASRHGATPLLRPDDLAGDGARSEDVVLHALDQLGAENDDVVVMIQCTSPFIEAEDIRAVVMGVVRDGADSAFTSVPFHQFVWRKSAGDGVGVNHDALGERARRQDREPEWLETGAAYAMRVGGLRRTKKRFFGRVLPVETRGSALEVDEPEDLELARRLSESLRGRWPWPDLPELIVLDFDGVLTDDRVWTNQSGEESVVCSRSDGLGVALLREDFRVVVLSTERNPVVRARCDKLGIPCVQDVGLDKSTALARLAADEGVSLQRTAYVGNDVNDLEALRAVGYPITVESGHPSLRQVAGLVLGFGGNGALRELADLVRDAASRARQTRPA